MAGTRYFYICQIQQLSGKLVVVFFDFYFPFQSVQVTVFSPNSVVTGPPGPLKRTSFRETEFGQQRFATFIVLSL
jgi:hypothetical protein